VLYVAPDGFANGIAFWKTAGLSVAFGILFGFIAIIFLNCAEKFPKVWVHNSDFGSYNDVTYYSGKHYYIAVSGCAGFVVGVLRHLLGYPETLDGLFKEIGHYRVEPTTAPATVLLSAISLGCGASLGPEQALVSVVCGWVRVGLASL